MMKERVEIVDFSIYGIFDKFLDFESEARFEDVSTHAERVPDAGTGSERIPDFLARKEEQVFIRKYRPF